MVVDTISSLVVNTVSSPARGGMETCLIGASHQKQAHFPLRVTASRLLDFSQSRNTSGLNFMSAYYCCILVSSMLWLSMHQKQALELSMHLVLLSLPFFLTTWYSYCPGRRLFYPPCNLGPLGNNLVHITLDNASSAAINLASVVLEYIC